MVFAFRSLPDMQDAAHIIMTECRHKIPEGRLFCQGYKVNQREILSKNFIEGIQMYPLAKCQKSVRDMLNYSFPFNTVDLCCEGFVNFHNLQDFPLSLSL